MEEKIKRFMEKKKISVEKIMYVIRTSKKTYIYTSDGQINTTYFSMKKIIEILDSNEMRVINKGTAVNLRYVSCITNGKYEMKDGMILCGRVRTPGEHNRNRRMIENLSGESNDTAVSGAEPFTTVITKEDIEKRFSILDDLPMPFAVFEVKLEKGKATDLLFCYLNHKMAEFVDTNIDEAKGKSFYAIFRNGDKKWLEINEEVVLTGKSNSVHRFSPEIGKYLSVYYFRPAMGYSAFAVVK